MSNQPGRTFAWAPGQEVGAYTILGHLASGGMAEVFLARPTDDPTGRRLMALKRINEEFTSDDEFVRMFLDEARIGLHLSHPHLVRTYGLERDGTCPYLALEYLSGESLQDIILLSRKKRRPIPPHYVARWVANAANGLHYAHRVKSPGGDALRIVHRDISPHNLFITYRGKMKVVDFGIAQATIKSTHTQTGYVKGKLAYLSPEQVSQGQVDGRTDVFALGIVLFEALSLQPLFPDSVSDGEIVEALAGSDPLERVRSRNPKIPAALDEIVAHAMSMTLADRYSSADALQKALEEWLAEEGGEPTADELGDYVRQLFPDRLASKDALIRTSLDVALNKQAALADEPTATDLDLRSHPELMRLASSGKRNVAPAPPTTEMRLADATRVSALTTAQTQDTAWIQVKRFGTGFWVRMGLLGVVAFAVTLLLGSLLSSSPPKSTESSAHLRLVVPAGAEVRVDGATYDPRALTSAGRHHIVASYRGLTHVEDVVVEAGDDREVRIDFGGGP